ncbi:MAG: protoheme IX farnesyltransferase [Phycisphaeraceae bacterium]|nr:protoheme IX farnesyltransferase [Phycisphaeraceae bacterium]
MTQMTQDHPDAFWTDSLTIARGLRSLLADLSQLAKPRITLMVAITAYIGYSLGLAGLVQDFSWAKLCFALLGTSLSCMGASTLNQIAERDADALMLRTRHRPLPAGRMTTRQAMLFALTLCTLGVGLLATFNNSLAALIAVFTIVSYVLIYTPMKRLSSLSLIIGAVPGALPPVIGFAAARNGVGLEAWAIFALMFVWQVPHFLAIAWLYRQDYARGGFRTLAVLDPTGKATFRQIVLWCLLLLPVGSLPLFLNLSGLFYFSSALVLGLLFLALGLQLMLQPSEGRARRMFFASLIYLPLVLAFLLIDRY